MPRSHQSPAQRFAELRRELQTLDYFCKGTVLMRMMKCGQPACACRTDPAKRHGPYWEWTFKVKGKTVNVRLRAAAVPLYQAAAQQHRKLKSLLNRLEKVSRSALTALAKEAEPKAKAPTSPSSPRRSLPKSMRH